MTARLFIPWFRYHPFVVEVGHRQITIYPFSWMMWTGVVTTLILAALFAQENGRSMRETMRFGIYILLLAFPISKLFNGLLYKPSTLRLLVESPGSIAGVSFGWSVYGGVLGGILGAWLWKWRTGGSILEIGDSFGFGAPFGWCIGRVGCFLVHDHPGRVSSFPLAVADFQLGEPPWPPRHDLGLYEAILLGSIAVLFLFLSRRPRKPGFYLALVGLLYAPARFLLDFLRAPYEEGGDIRYGGLTPSQYVSVVLLFVAALVMRQVRATSDRPG
jgi:phosphatidylglycerol:prolipoprotein diacylglycerol transferase